MRVYRVQLPNFQQISTHDQSAVVAGLVGLFSGPVQNCRFITFAVPATLDHLENERRKLAMQQTEPWARQGLLQEARLIADLAHQGDMRRARHYFIDYSDSLTAADLSNWRVFAENEYPPLPIPGDYAERPDHMVPITLKGNRQAVDNSRYKYGILSSFQLSRTWDWRHPLAQTIADADGPMVICVDVRRIHPERVGASAEFWEGMILNGQDRNAQLAKEEAEAALMIRDEFVHHVRILFMLLDKSGKRLKERLDSLRKVTTQYMKVDRLIGYQAPATAMFGPMERPGGMPSGHFNVLSRGVAVSAGLWGVGRDQPTEGIYTGISVDEVARHVAFLNWQGNDPFHGIILGRTGKGKTVGAQALAWRLAEQGAQVIFLEPQGHGRRLAALAGEGNCSYSQLSYETTTINILDVVHDNPSKQYDHVLTLLGLLLDPLGSSPRQFTNAEVAIVRAALDRTYSHYDWHDELLKDQTITPTLEIFCHKLREVVGEREQRGQMVLAANGLARRPVGAPAGGQGFQDPVATAGRYLVAEIEALYVYGDYAANFNTTTNLDLKLDKQIIVFDFSNVPERRRSLFYYVVLSSLNREIRSRPRKRAIFVDEVHYMNQEPALMEAMAHMVKTVRTFGCAVILIDQDLEAFVGVDGAQAESMAAGLNIAAGQFIINNVSWTIAFGMKRDAAYRLAHHYPDEILDSHAEFLARMGSDDKMGKGMAVVRADGKADTVYFQLRPMEAEALFGS